MTKLRQLFQSFINLFKRAKSIDAPAPTKSIIQSTPGSLPYYYDAYKQAVLSESLVSKNRVAWALDKVLKGEPKYRAVEQVTNVPWYLVAALHCLESSFNWSTCLHNGQPWSKVTTLVPKGLGPWLSWEEAAIDALRRSRSSEVQNWTLEECLKFAESHNGLGYLRNHPTVKSPYLWSCTTLYTKGKYASDGQFDSQIVSEQVGAAALFKALEEGKHIHLTYSHQGLIK